MEIWVQVAQCDHAGLCDQLAWDLAFVSVACPAAKDSASPGWVVEDGQCFFVWDCLN